MKTKISTRFAYAIMATIILYLFWASSQAHADTPYFVAGDPTLIMKIGTWFGVPGTDSAGDAHAITLAFETRSCNAFKLCYTPYFIHLSNDAGKNAGLGVDITYKMLKRAQEQDHFILMGGLVAFNDRLNSDAGEHVNFHVGVGVEIQQVMLSFDAYGSANKRINHDADRDNVPTYLFNIGYHFK